MQHAPAPEEDVRAVIGRAAREVAWESGLAAVTLRRVSSRAGLDPGTIARYEPSMTALAACVFRQIAHDELQVVVEGAASLLTAGEALWFVAEVATADASGNADWLWAEVWSVGARNLLVAQAAREINQAWTEFIAGLIEGGVRSGEFASVDSLFVARTVLALVDGSGVRSVFSRDTAGHRKSLLTTFLGDMLGVNGPAS